MSRTLQLLGKRRFAPLFITQFLGAFNDNLYKNALVVLLTFQTTSWTNLPAGIMVNLAAGIFILPFFLFSASAGQLADKYDKALLARLAKQLEILIMLVAALGFWLHNLSVLMTALFLLGLQSTLFGPVKYSILPQHLHSNELLGGNALVEAGTFAAILLGTLTGGLLAAAGHAPLWIIGGGLLVAIVGYLASRKIPSAPAPAPELRLTPNPLAETLRNLKFAHQHQQVFIAILAISWFWLYGALLLAQIPGFSKQHLGGDEILTTLILAIFTLGIGSGSILCNRLSGGKLELGLVLVGAMGISLFGLDLLFAAPAELATTSAELSQLLGTLAVWRSLFDLFMLGLTGGLFIVPLYTMIQLRSPEHQRARIIACNNIFNALFMVAGALAAMLLLGAGLSIPQLFALAALANALFVLWLCWQAPEFWGKFHQLVLNRTANKL